MILKDAGYGFAMLDVFFRYDRQVANLIAVVGYKVLERVLVVIIDFVGW
jgi:hypothetical protein